MPARRFAFAPVLLVAALVPVVDVLFATPQAAKSRKVAFLVGVGKYDHKFGDLGTAPENDVSELAKTLGEGGFEVITLTGTNTGAGRATKANIESRFKDVLRGGGGKPAVKDGDTVLVVLCGHGIQAEALDPTTQKKEEQPFYCPVDALPDDTSTMVALNALIRAAEPHGATALFLVDACREVTDANRGTRSGIQGKKVNLPRKTAVLFSCGQGQLAHQDGSLGANKKGHGLFTYAVLKTLRTDAGPKDDVSWTELVAGVQKSFRSDEFKAMLPAGKVQSPVLATGELDDAHLMAAKPGGTPKVVVTATADNSPPPGFNALFNGKTLAGWQGNTDVKQRTTLSRDALTMLQGQRNRIALQHWKVQNGAIVCDGKGGVSLQTLKNYANIEMYVDWKIARDGDSGIYLRGQPQVQIWDSDNAPGAKGDDRNSGSGGLWNNKPVGSRGQRPLKKADKPVGEWNTFHIMMVGDEVTVNLNGELVVDKVKLQNFFDPGKPLPASGPIELQIHTDQLWFKNIYVKELP